MRPARSANKIAGKFRAARRPRTAQARLWSRRACRETKRRRLLLHAVVFLHHAVLLHAVVLFHGVLGHRVLLHRVLGHGVFLHAVVLAHLVLGEGGRGERQAERKSGGRNSERNAGGADGHLGVIPLKTGLKATDAATRQRSRSTVCYPLPEKFLILKTPRIKAFQACFRFGMNSLAKVGGWSCFCRTLSGKCAPQQRWRPVPAKFSLELSD